MSPVPPNSDGGGNGHQLHSFSLNTNVLLQLVTASQLIHIIVLPIGRKSPSLVFGITTLLALVAYVMQYRPLEDDLHFLTLMSTTPHPRANEWDYSYDSNNNGGDGSDAASTRGLFNLYGLFGLFGLLENKWFRAWTYNIALVSIYASAFMQLQRLSPSNPRYLLTANPSLTRRSSASRWTPEWLIVLVCLAGAIALAGMRSPLLETFLGSDFDTNRQLSGMSTLVAFLLILWRGVTFLDIFSTMYSLGDVREKDTAVLALWQRASLPMAAELLFDILSILFYESLTFKTFSRDEAGHALAGIRVFDSPVAIALSALIVTFAKILYERHAHSSSISSPTNDRNDFALTVKYKQ